MSDSPKVSTSRKADLDTDIDRYLRTWSEEDWNSFFRRYMVAQFNLGGERPRASIPLRERDDDVILSRVIDLALEALNG